MALCVSTFSAISLRCCCVGGLGNRNSGRHMERNGHAAHLSLLRQFPSVDTISCRIVSSCLFKPNLTSFYYIFNSSFSQESTSRLFIHSVSFLVVQAFYA